MTVEICSVCNSEIKDGEEVSVIDAGHFNDGLCGFEPGDDPYFWICKACVPKVYEAIGRIS